MTTKARKYCASFPCSNLAVGGAYCALHRPAAPAKETDPFYLSVKWRRFREWYLGKHPLCEQCLIDGRQDTPASMVDHVVELRDGGAPTSEGNGMSMCWKCHGIKTALNATRNHQQSREDNRIGSAKETY